MLKCRNILEEVNIRLRSQKAYRYVALFKVKGAPSGFMQHSVGIYFGVSQSLACAHRVMNLLHMFRLLSLFIKVV